MLVKLAAYRVLGDRPVLFCRDPRPYRTSLTKWNTFHGSRYLFRPQSDTCSGRVSMISWPISRVRYTREEPYGDLQSLYLGKPDLFTPDSTLQLPVLLSSCRLKIPAPGSILWSGLRGPLVLTMSRLCLGSTRLSLNANIEICGGNLLASRFNYHPHPSESRNCGRRGRDTSRRRIHRCSMSFGTWGTDTGRE